MPTFKIVPYKHASAGARHLKKALDAVLPYEVIREQPDYYIKSNEWIINWGAGHFRGYKEEGATGTRILNPAHKLCICINKIDFFRAMDAEGVNIPKWTTSSTTAAKWVAGGVKTYCRTEIEGKDGSGIVVARKQSELVSSPLYTQAVDATEEYRVHIFQHKPIFDLEKWKEHATQTEKDIRTGGMGWIYVRDTVVPDGAKAEAIKASKALGMDFCAVDLLYNTKTGQGTVLEMNSAPELGPWTSKAYAKELVALLKK